MMFVCAVCRMCSRFLASGNGTGTPKAYSHRRVPTVPTVPTQKRHFILLNTPSKTEAGGVLARIGKFNKKWEQWEQNP